jgi:hypothetical protein
MDSLGGSAGRREDSGDDFVAMGVCDLGHYLTRLLHSVVFQFVHESAAGEEVGAGYGEGVSRPVAGPEDEELRSRYRFVRTPAVQRRSLAHLAPAHAGAECEGKVDEREHDCYVGHWWCDSACFPHLGNE